MRKPKRQIQPIEVDVNDRKSILRFLVKYIVKYPSLNLKAENYIFVNLVYNNSIAGQYPCLTSTDIREIKGLVNYWFKAVLEGRYIVDETGELVLSSSPQLK